jgi:hypothetical protein
MENVATYSEARSEYTKQLATLIVPPLVGWFQQLWSRNSSNKQQALSLFQSECEEIPRWNQDRVHDEVRLLIDRTGCDYMEELMTAVFIAHTKVLTAVRLSKREKKLSITVPKLDHFIHRIFREAARCYWKAPFLFMESGSVVDRQKNVLQIEALAAEAITAAVRTMLPVKQILKDYMEEDDQEEIDEDELVPVTTEDEKEAKVVPETNSTPSPPTIAHPPIQPESKPETENTVPSVVNIDTEPAVSFSDYDSVFDEKKGAPEMVYAPKTGEDDDDDIDSLASDNAPIDITGEATPLGDDDAEDLDGTKPKVNPKPANSESLDDLDGVEILE